MMRVVITTRQPDGTWKTIEKDEPPPIGDPHYDRVKALAEATGKITVGVKATRPGKPDVEHVDTLDNL